MKPSASDSNTYRPAGSSENWNPPASSVVTNRFKPAEFVGSIATRAPFMGLQPSSSHTVPWILPEPMGKGFCRKAQFSSPTMQRLKILVLVQLGGIESPLLKYTGVYSRDDDPSEFSYVKQGSFADFK
jgi:hypothetical protein